MKIGYISDLHVDHWQHVDWDRLFPPVDGLDFLIVAGDIAESRWARNSIKNDLESRYGCSVISPMGNHDYYGDWFPSLNPGENDGEVFTVDGMKIFVATMWTKLKPSDAEMTRAITDFRLIKGISVDRWNALHDATLQRLYEAKPDIVVTHHAPSTSLRPKYANGPVARLNRFFVTDVDFEAAGDPKLWIHGHVHDKWDYVAPNGKTRVVCNPVGYPSERHLAGATLEVVEI